ncbi:MAG: hypothetical protein MJ116_00960 [Lachnospiraceae bacterium]|nr:hypothetical protein [Lachnospiraceae bacterium]
MKKIGIKIMILAGIFIAAVLFFSSILNHKETKKSRALTSPTLPIMYMDVEGNRVNPLSGYTDEINKETIRESLTPISGERSLAFEIKTYDNQIKGVDYEVTSLMDGSLLENGKVKNLTEEEGILSSQFQLGNPILLDQEYMLKFTVTLGDGKPVYFYTRILQRSNTSVTLYLDYIREFYENCLYGTLTDAEINNLEPQDAYSNSSLHSVNIHSGRKQITWGNLSPAIVRRAVPVIREVNDMTCSVTQNYLISAEDEEGNQEYYSVDEFYRMRIKLGKVVLLDFEREATQIFDPSLDVMIGSGINLGVVGKNIQYVSNNGAYITAFEIDGELWSYNRSAHKATCVFSFRENANLDARTENRDHAISISSVSEGGDISFVVYGYNSTDLHEGQMGISVYHYYAERNIAEEILFIPCNVSFEMMQKDLSRLSFVNNQQFFFYLNHSLYQVDLTEGTSTVLVDGVQDNCVAVSKSQKNLAWMEEMKYSDSRHITVMNLETGNGTQIEAPEGEKIRVLGFINEDVIYGLAKNADIGLDAAGREVFAMYDLRIQNPSGDVEKEYQQSSTFITGITESEGLVELKRAARSDGGIYVPVDSDHIINNVNPEGDTVTLKLDVDDRAGTQSFLIYTVKGSSSNLLSMDSQYLEQDSVRELTLETGDDWSSPWYVYGKGKLQTTCTEAAEAIALANSCVGVVLDEESRYVWERGNYENIAKIDPSLVNPVLFEGVLDQNLMQEKLGSDYAVWNLSGCSLGDMYYFLAHGCPILTRMSEGGTSLILGFDVYNVWLYNPENGSTYAVAKEDAQAMISQYGNLYLTCRRLVY